MHSPGSPTTSDVALTVSGVSKFYGRFKALNRVSFSLDTGHPCIIVGPNGCGKSTLLKIIAGLLTPDEGSITYPGNNQTPKIGYISHEPGLYASLTVLENIKLFHALLNEKRSISEILEEWNISSLSDRTVGTISKGQQARVGLARACMGRPSLLILDEPTSFLDADSVTRFTAIMRSMKSQAHVIIASHDMERLKDLGAQVFTLEAA